MAAAAAAASVGAPRHWCLPAANSGDYPLSRPPPGQASWRDRWPACARSFGSRAPLPADAPGMMIATAWDPSCPTSWALQSVADHWHAHLPEQSVDCDVSVSLGARRVISVPQLPSKSIFEVLLGVLGETAGQESDRKLWMLRAGRARRPAHARHLIQALTSCASPQRTLSHTPWWPRCCAAPRPCSPRTSPASVGPSCLPLAPRRCVFSQSDSVREPAVDQRDGLASVETQLESHTK